MMKIRFLAILLFLAISCNNKSDFEQKIDALKQVIPTISGNLTFSFAELSENVWEWQNSQNLLEMDSIFYADNIYKKYPAPIMKYKKQSNYYYKIIDLQDVFVNLITLQYQGYESYMYLLQFDKQGNWQKTHVLASIFKSPIDYEEVKSSIQGNKITTYKCYMDENIVKRDTIEILW